MLYRSHGMIILKFIQDSDSTADNDRYSFRLQVSMKLTSNINSIQYVVKVVPPGTAGGHQTFIIIDHKKLDLIK